MATIKEYIEKAVESKETDRHYVDRARVYYSLGIDHGEAGNTIEEIVQSLGRGENIIESTLTRRLCHENVRPLSVWAKDERSLDINFAMPEESATVQSREKAEETYEMDVRKSVADVDISFYFTQLLVYGFAVASVGLNDTFFVPDAEAAHYDTNGQWIIITRDVKLSVLQQIAETWESEEEDAGTEMFEETEPLEEKEIEHGQIKDPEGGYIEFIYCDGQVWWREHGAIPVLHIQFFAVNAETREAMGIYGLCSEEERASVRLYQAIANRVQKTIDASLIISGSTMSNETVRQIYGGGIIKDNSVNNGNVGDERFKFVPSRVGEISNFVEELERLENKARELTGLYRRPTSISDSNTSASEALIVYSNSLETHREIINNFSHIFAYCLKFMIMRDYEVEVSVKVVSNPIDAEIRREGIEKLLPVVRESLEKDPTGKLLGGMFTPTTLRELVIMSMRDYKLSADILASPQDTALSTKEGMQQAQDEEREAAQRLADAEIKKGEADLINANTKLLEVEKDMGIHNDNMTLKLVELQLQAQKQGDDVALKMIENVNKAATARRQPDAPETS